MESSEYNMHKKDTPAAADENLLWRLIDGEATGEEKRKTEQLIASSPQWQQKYAELLQLNQLLHAAETDEPSVRFTKNVMELVSQHRVASPAGSYVNRYVFLSIGTLFLAVIAACFVISVQNIDWKSAGQEQYTALPDDLHDAVTNTNHMLLWVAAASVLGFYLLSRYLSSRRKRHTAA